MNRHIPKIALMGCMAIAAAPFFAHGQPGVKCLPPADTAFRTMSRAEMELMIANVAETNPDVIDLLRSDPVVRNEQINNIRELLALASQAVKEGIAVDAANCAELVNIHDEIIAISYFASDAPATAKVRFRDSITDGQLAAFWNGSSVKEAADRKAHFDRFLSAKLALLARNSADGAEPKLSQEEREQAKEFFARTQITVGAFDARKAQATDRDKAVIETQIKLQQAQFLARQYSEVLSEKTAASEEEINTFITARPELSSTAKRMKAEQILDRAKKGEDFAALANQFSQDPGNRNEKGELAGGLYTDVNRGVFLPAFEQAALSLKPGEIYPSLVETDFGFHVIKLERKDPSADGTFDVRHVLIDTTVKNPDDPDGRGLPVREFARRQIETEKERKLLAQIIEANGITVASDFSVPAASAIGSGAEQKRPR